MLNSSTGRDEGEARRDITDSALVRVIGGTGWMGVIVI